MKGFVLAAGYGTRLRPLSLRLPKPAWPLFDVPLVVHVLRLLGGVGVGEVVVNLHHLPDALTAAVAPWLSGLPRVRWSLEAEILGTGGALVPWRDWLRGGTFVLANGDTYQELDLGAMAMLHRERGALATLSVRPSASPRAPLEVNAAGRIVRFLSARAPGAGGGTPCEFSGVHLLEPSVLEELPPGRSCINADVHLRLVARGAPLWGHLEPAKRFWSDLGTPGRYLAAHRDLLQLGRLPPGVPGQVCEVVAAMSGGGTLTPPVYLGAGATVEPGAVVGPFAVLGRDARVAAGVTVENAVAWAGSTVSADLRRAVLSGWGERLTNGEE